MAKQVRKRLEFVGGFIIVLVVIGVWFLRNPRPQGTLQDPSQIDFAESVGADLEISNSIGMKFRLIPPGRFDMGSPRSERDRTVWEYQHEVTISEPFYMGTEEVTQEQFEQITGYNPSHFSEGGPLLPVESVTWTGVVAFCNALSLKEGLNPVYEISEVDTTCHLDRNGYRLPVEAEWEYACRAGTATAFYVGPNEPDAVAARRLKWTAWFIDNTFGLTHEAGIKYPNPWGLHNMIGNVWEWSWDWFAPYPITDSSFMGPQEGTQGRVIRGGGWYSHLDELRCASRRPFNPREAWNILGFRCARKYMGPE